MKNIILVLTCIIIAGLAFTGFSKKETDASSHDYIFDRAPLARNAYAELPPGAIQARGWLRRQLQEEANGIGGKLGQYYPVIGNNAWKGGNGDSWERGPYYLDGLVPLAYTLRDPKLIRQAGKWINWILNSQQPDGYFGPRPNPGVKDTSWVVQKANKADWWPRMPVLKAMESYYEATHDKRVISFMTKYFRYQLKMLPEKPLKHWTWWAEARGGDNQASVYWLYNRTGDKFLLKLAPLLYKQTLDWTDGFLTGDLPSTHGVNVAMAIKQPAVEYMQAKEQKYLTAVKRGLANLRRHDGDVQGSITADEMMHGLNPTQGTELDVTVEMMYSLEMLTRLTGNVAYADHLEKLAYNSLPTQVERNFMGRQYYQQANQISIHLGRYNFSTPYGNGICYGILTGYPCCTVNMSQAWPKFVQNMWMASGDNGLTAMEYGPNSVKAKVGNGKDVKITEDTYYPFDDTITFTVSVGRPTAFPLHLRIPGWVDSTATIKLNGKIMKYPERDEVTEINRTWNNGDKVTLTLPMSVHISRWYNESMGIQRGPLVFALHIPAVKKKVGDKYTVPVWGYYPTGKWNYGLIVNRKNPSSSFKVIVSGRHPDDPWTPQTAPIRLQAEGKEIPEWTIYNGYAGPLPYSPVSVSPGVHSQKLELLPYGSTILRIGEIPRISH